MAKTIKTVVKLQIPAGKANPAPPVGTVLGPQGILIIEFCTQFNERTRELGDVIIPAEITIYEDRTFTFITKQPPAADLLRRAAKVEKGAATVGKEKVGSVSTNQLRALAEQKLPDMSARDADAAMKVLAGTARSMGIEIID